MNKQEMKERLEAALTEYLEPIIREANATRERFWLPLIDVTNRPEVKHQIDYFKAGFKDGAAGYYDRWYDDKKAATAYQQGNYAGREFCGDTFQVI